MKFLIGLLLVGVLGGVLAAVALPKPRATLLGTLPATPRAAVSYRHGLLVATAEGGLYRIEAAGTLDPVFKVTGQHVIDLAVGGDTVYALAFSPSRHRHDLQLVDPATGSVLRSVSMGGSVVDLAGVLANGRIVIIEGGQVRFLDPTTYETMDRVLVTGGMLTGGHLVGTTLYASRGYAGGLVIIDTRTSELVDVIKTAHWLTSAVVSGRRAYVTGSLDGPGILDLDSQTYHRVDVIDFFVNADGDGYALVSDAIYRLDEDGRPVRRTRLPGNLRAAVSAAQKTSLLAINDDRAFIACDAKVFKLRPGWYKSELDELPRAVD